MTKLDKYSICGRQLSRRGETVFQGTQEENPTQQTKLSERQSEKKETAVMSDMKTCPAEAQTVVCGCHPEEHHIMWIGTTGERNPSFFFSPRCKSQFSSVMQKAIILLIICLLNFNIPLKNKHKSSSDCCMKQKQKKCAHICPTKLTSCSPQGSLTIPAVHHGSTFVVRTQRDHSLGLQYNFICLLNSPPNK